LAIAAGEFSATGRSAVAVGLAGADATGGATVSIDLA
jgi:hypothetical protein